jgi:hypothetical protein
MRCCATSELNVVNFNNTTVGVVNFKGLGYTSNGGEYGIKKHGVCAEGQLTSCIYLNVFFTR